MLCAINNETTIAEKAALSPFSIAFWYKFPSTPDGVILSFTVELYEFVVKMTNTSRGDTTMLFVLKDNGTYVDKISVSKRICASLFRINIKSERGKNIPLWR